MEGELEMCRVETGVCRKRLRKSGCEEEQKHGHTGEACGLGGELARFLFFRMGDDGPGWILMGQFLTGRSGRERRGAAALKSQRRVAPKQKQGSGWLLVGGEFLFHATRDVKRTYFSMADARKLSRTPAF